METVDILVVGGSFSGLAFGHHISPEYKTLIIDRKSRLDTAIESTGLVTQATHDLLAEFCDVDAYIPNKITTIGVVAPDYKNHFFSHTDKPWIYSTDTPALVEHMSKRLPPHVELRLGAGLLNVAVESNEMYPVCATYLQGGEKKQVRAKFLIGADGSHSLVAKQTGLSQNKRFLAGHEKVFYGDITFGDHPENTIYHFWFGEFSLGYGGWLSPTIINGRKAFRLGLAKLEADARDLKKIDEFIKILEEKKIIRIEGDSTKCILAFGHLIPIGGVLRNVYNEHILLVGDAAGFCGAFAADGIKGSLVSGKVGAGLVSRYLKGEKDALKQYRSGIQNHNHLIRYFHKQLVYRFLWDRMKSNRSFGLLYELIAKDKDNFLYQFCDSKDRHRSLIYVVVKIKNIPQLVKYAWSIILDLFKK